MRLATKYRVEMPICEQIYYVLFENLDPLEAISNSCPATPSPKRSANRFSVSVDSAPRCVIAHWSLVFNV